MSKKKSYKKKYAYGTDYIQPDYSQAQEVNSKKAGVDGVMGSVSGMVGNGAFASVGSAAGGIAEKAIGTNDDGSPKTSGAAIGSGLKYAGMGAQIGSAAGPIGTVVGGVLGAAYGAARGGADAKAIQTKYKNARNYADSINKQNQYSATETEQVGYAKKGVDLTKPKYPGGTSSVKGEDKKITPTAKPVSNSVTNLNVNAFPSKIPQSEDAKKYYSNVQKIAYSTVKGEGHQFDGKGKGNYDQTRVEKDPNSPNYGKEVKNNTCVGYACHIAKEAGAKEPQQVEYNPYFTRDHKKLGWERIPADSAKTGDRVQFWAEDNTGGNKIKDVGENTYIKNKYPKHMGIYMSKASDGNTYTYEDGDSQKNAKVGKRPVNDSTATVYRYVGLPTPPVKNVAGNIKQYEEGTQEIMAYKSKYKRAKYPDGSSAIKLQPSEITQIRGIADPMQKRQAIWDIMGYAPKNYPAGSEGYKRQEEMYSSAVNYVNQGYRPFSTPKGKGYEKVYNKGTKEIEIEGDEVHMKKVGGKYKLKGDYKGGPSHEEGGIPIVAEAGDVIFPSHKRPEVVKAIREGNDSKLESIRKTLPKDTKKKYAYGGIVPQYAKANKGIDTQIPLSGEPVQTGGMYAPRSFNAGVAVPQSGSNTKAPGFNPFANVSGSKVAGVASTIGEVAPIAYNIGQGLFGKAEKTTRRTYNPSKYNYQDNSEPLRNEARSLYNADKQLIRNASGGNAGTYLANVGMASNNKFERLQQVNNAEAEKMTNVQNANVDIENQAKGMNLNLNNQYDQLDLQNKARKDDYLSAGLGQLSDFSQKKALERNLKANDEIRLGTLETTNYKVDSKTKKSSLKYKRGTKSIQMKKC